MPEPFGELLRQPFRSSSGGSAQRRLLQGEEDPVRSDAPSFGVLENPFQGCRQSVQRAPLLTGVEAEAIWQWGFIKRLVKGLLCCEIGPKENAAECLAVDEASAEAEVD
jgi:hypothetical protein